jgi:hypothetical protein
MQRNDAFHNKTREERPRAASFEDSLRFYRFLCARRKKSGGRVRAFLSAKKKPCAEKEIFRAKILENPHRFFPAPCTSERNGQSLGKSLR